MERITADTPLSDFPGVGPARQRALAKLGLERVGDLLRFYPRAYEDRTRVFPVAAAPIDTPVCVEAMVAQPPRLSRIRRGLDLVKTRAVDDTGAMELTFFNQPYLQRSLQRGESYIFYGKMELVGGRRQMTNPVLERPGRRRATGRILPRYPLTAGVSNYLLVDLAQAAVEHGLDSLEETLPAAVRERFHLPGIQEACAQIHFPDSFAALDAARARLAFEELFYLTAGLSLLRKRRERGRGVALNAGSVPAFQALLPFPLTGAQRRVMDQCAADLCAGPPMNRLVQGDVGSGKTAIAAFCLWRAAKSGAQGALMAPTELLAQQHYQTLRAMLEPDGVAVGLLTGSQTPAEKRAIKTALAAGELQVVVGTHALLSRGVDFRDLALAVVDEQHRFGVGQRSALAGKGTSPHLLVLSATPIPRTLALILYGDLDVSVLDQLPPGRRAVETYLVSDRYHQRLYAFLDKLVAQGRQGYIVCPAVEEDPEEGDSTLKSVEQYAQYLSQEVFPHLRVAFVHGRMKARDKEAVMAAFAGGEVQILVSTTVVEVGVDVPNAAFMVVENADRFGLSQLHQLRGRVGRGKHQSYCVLVSNTRDPETRGRLKTLCATTDGFQIAEADLKARGPGDFFGQRQHGLPTLRLADLNADMRLLSAAQRAAQDLLAQDPDLQAPEHQPVLRRVREIFQEDPDIFN